MNMFFTVRKMKNSSEYFAVSLCQYLSFEAFGSTFNQVKSSKIIFSSANVGEIYQLIAF